MRLRRCHARAHPATTAGGGRAPLRNRGAPPGNRRGEVRSGNGRHDALRYTGAVVPVFSLSPLSDPGEARGGGGGGGGGGNPGGESGCVAWDGGGRGKGRSGGRGVGERCLGWVSSDGPGGGGKGDSDGRDWLELGGEGGDLYRFPCSGHLSG
jgi:hypothetical protein